MNDKSITKIVCRIITLFNYVTVLTMLYLMYEFLPLILENKLNEFFENYFLVVLICAIPILITMIIALIFKYTLVNESKVKQYRILDVITRTFTTVPTTIAIHYYITNEEEYHLIVFILIGILIFYILNLLFKFALQETMNVTFMKSDSL